MEKKCTGLEEKIECIKLWLCNINRKKNLLGFSFTSVEKILKSNGLSLSIFSKGIYRDSTPCVRLLV